MSVIDFPSPEAVKSRENLRRILEVSASHSLTPAEQRGIKHNEHIVYLLTPIIGYRLEQDLVDLLISSHINARGTFSQRRAEGIAMDAIRDIATDMLYGSNGLVMPQGERSHAINFRNENDILLGFDLTAGFLLDYNQGNYSVLAIRAGSLDELLQKAQDLYGGIWRQGLF